MNRRRELRADEQGVGSIFGIPPILLIFGVIVVLFLLLGGFLVFIFATKTLITVALIGIGLILLLKQSFLAGMPEQYRMFVPLILILLGILFYVGAFKFLGG